MPGVLHHGASHSIMFLKGTIWAEVWKCVKVFYMIKHVHIHVYAHPCGEQRLDSLIVAQGYSTLFFAFVFVCRECMCASISMKLQMCVGKACMSVCVYTCEHTCGNQGLMSRVILNHSPPYILSRVSHCYTELRDIGTLASQLASGISCLHFF